MSQAKRQRAAQHGVYKHGDKPTKLYVDQVEDGKSIEVTGSDGTSMYMLTDTPNVSASNLWLGRFDRITGISSGASTTITEYIASSYVTVAVGGASFTVSTDGYYLVRFTASCQETGLGGTRYLEREFDINTTTRTRAVYHAAASSSPGAISTTEAVALVKILTTDTCYFKHYHPYGTVDILPSKVSILFVAPL